MISTGVTLLRGQRCVDEKFFKIIVEKYNSQYMGPTDFFSLKSKIFAAVDAKLKLQGAPKDPQGFSLIEGYILTPIQSSPNLPGVGVTTTITMIGIVGNSTGAV